MLFRSASPPTFKGKDVKFNLKAKLDDVSTEGSEISSKRYLLIVLLLNVFICFGQNYVFDFPQAMEGALIPWLKVETVQISLLYSIYSLPNIIFSPVTGYVIEKLGCNKSAVLYTALVFFGQLIIYYGIENRSYFYVILGRGIYGIGGEGLTILQLTINELWFYGNFLSMSVAWCDMVAVGGLFAGNYLNPELFTHTRTLKLTFFICSFLCFLSFLAGAGYYFVHNKYIDKVALHDNDIEEDSFDQIAVFKNKEGEVANKKKKYNNIVTQSMAPGGNAEEQFNTLKIEFGFKSIKYFNKTYWILCINMLLLANCYYQFTNIATEIFENRFGYTYDEANHFTIIPELAFLAISLPLSKWIEVRGNKPMFMLASAVIFFASYVMMYLMEPGKSNFLYVILVLLGTSYSILTCALFSSVALSIPKAGVSMGYSILTFIENFGLSFLPIYFGYISKDRTFESYNECILSLIILSVCAVISCAWLVVYDTQNTRLLTLPENSKKVKRLRRNIDSDFFERSFKASMMISKDEDSFNNSNSQHEPDQNGPSNEDSDKIRKSFGAK